MANNYDMLLDAVESFTDNSEDFAIVEDFDKITIGKMYVVKDKEEDTFYGVLVKEHSEDQLTYVIMLEKSTGLESVWEVTNVNSAVELGNGSTNVSYPENTITEEELHKDYIFYSIPGMSGGKRNRRRKSKKTNKRKTKRRRSTRRRR
jgi:hypothetical protein